MLRPPMFPMVDAELGYRRQLAREAVPKWRKPRRVSRRLSERHRPSRFRAWRLSSTA